MRLQEPRRGDGLGSPSVSFPSGDSKKDRVSVGVIVSIPSSVLFRTPRFPFIGRSPTSKDMSRYLTGIKGIHPTVEEYLRPRLVFVELYEDLLGYCNRTVMYKPPSVIIILVLRYGLRQV